MKYILKFILLFAFASYSYSQSKYNYDIDSPDKKIILPTILNEVSGIAYIDSTHVAFVQDELGSVFIYDIKTDQIISQHKFSDIGDFEGLTYTGESLFILRSDGLLTEWSDFNINQNNGTIFTYDLKLSTFDNEGLVWDSLNNRLLIAGKSEPLIKENKKDRFIYGFDIDTSQLDSNPAYILNLKILEKFAKKNDVKFVDKKGKKKKFSFFPSGIAVHPLTQDIFIISAKSASIIIINQNGDVVQIISLDEDQYTQAEGITFLKDGTMLITNEAAGQMPTCFVHKMVESASF